MLLEVIATNVEDAKTAEAYGADRIELIRDMAVGGLTPTDDKVREVLAAVSIPVNVMIRPHSQSFVYTAADIAQMSHDVQRLNELGPNGMVLGALQSDGRIDEASLAELLRHIDGHIDVTFHKAFDECYDLSEGLRTLQKYPQITRVLTSGGAAKAPEAVSEIKKLTGLTEDSSLRILAGGGLRQESLASFIRQTGVPEVHFGSAVRYDGSIEQPINGEAIQAVKNIWRA